MTDMDFEKALNNNLQKQRKEEISKSINNITKILDLMRTFEIENYIKENKKEFYSVIGELYFKLEELKKKFKI
jgi:cobalamin biosynthesis Mg chelatase CobN